jgi:hypothetical protein
MSGESLSFGEDPQLAIEPQWYRSLSIVGGPQRLVEPVTKWATQAADVHTLYEHVVRAGEFGPSKTATPRSSTSCRAGDALNPPVPAGRVPSSPALREMVPSSCSPRAVRATRSPSSHREVPHHITGSCVIIN